MKREIFDTKAISPMLIAEQVDPYDDPDSIFEFKIDGIRTILYADSNSCDIRNKRDVKMIPRFPELKEIYRSCKYKCILDGELNVLINGKPDFNEVQKRSIMTDPFKIQLAASRKPANFIAYDIIYYKNHLVTELPLIERKALLHEVVNDDQFIRKSKYIDTYGKSLFEVAKQEALEGVVGKKKNSLYWFGKKTRDWKKIKVMADREYIIVGFIPKSNHMTSLVLALYNENNELVITNHVALGVSLSKLKEHGMKISNCPLNDIPKGIEDTTWIEPMVGTIEFMPSDKAGLRQPVFKGIRDDKLPEECRIEV